MQLLLGFQRDSWRGVRFDHIYFEQLIHEITGLSLLIDFFVQGASTTTLR